MVIATYIHKYIKNHWILHFKWMIFLHVNYIIICILKNKSKVTKKVHPLYEMLKYMMTSSLLGDGKDMTYIRIWFSLLLLLMLVEH